MRDRRGFTLIELMAVVLILGIMLGMALPNVTDLIRHQQLRGEARQLVSYLRGLQEEAITTEQNASIQFSSTGSYYLVAGKRHNISREIKYSVSPPVLGTLSFTPLGSLNVAQDTTVEFVDAGGRKVQVILKPSGRINIITP